MRNGSRKWDVILGSEVTENCMINEHDPLSVCKISSIVDIGLVALRGCPHGWDKPIDIRQTDTFSKYLKRLRDTSI